MDTLDIIISLLILVTGIIGGLKHGFMFQVVTLISLFLAAWASFHFSDWVGNFLSGFVQSHQSLLHPASFIVTFAIAYFLLFLLGMVISKAVKAVTGNTLDRFLGMVFAVGKNMLIAGLLIVAFDAINDTLGIISQEHLTSSRAYVFLRDTTQTLFPYIKGFITQQ